MKQLELGLRVIGRHSMKTFVYPSSAYPLRQHISISFSGGKTSAYMTKMVLDYFKAHEPRRQVVVVFANTGQEHEETLNFVHRCDQYFGFNTVWIEAVVNPQKGKGIRHKVVNFETASRDGRPFEDYIRKYGIPNQAYKQCTSRLKTEPMDSFRKSLGWKRTDYSTAIGIRADEMDRVSLTGIKEHGLFYPLVDARVTKDDVLNWWADQPFKLNIPEHWGNCKWCWKKSRRKLLTIAKNNPEFFDFPARMEKLYSLAGGKRRDGEERQPRVFFRGNMSTQQLLEAAHTTDFEEYQDNKFIEYDAILDLGSGCGESCEVGADLD